MIKNFKWLVLVSLTFVACNNEDDTVVSNSSDGMPLTSGTADFSKYVAIGDSFAAGYSDNALFIAGQNGAYPNILAQQFALVGGGAFTTPLMADNIGGLLFGGTQVAGPRLFFNGAPTPVSGVPTTEITNHLTGYFNNMGIPGAKSYHLLAPGYGNPMGVIANPPTASPYFSRFASSNTATVLGDAISQNPTFFSLWIGGNDELGYATAGGDETVNPLTPTATFDAVYNSIISQLTTGGKKGVIANLPYVTTLPYFYVVKYNQLSQANLTVGGANQVNALNAQLYGPLHNALAFLGQGDRINLLATTGNNPMLMKDETLVNLSAQLTQVLIGGGFSPQMAGAFGAIFGQARQTKSTDLICLSASSRIGQAPTTALDGVASPSALVNQLGVTFPMPDRYILIPTEVAEIKTFTDAYNTTIENAAEANGLAIFNAKAVMDQLTTTGVSANGYSITSTYATGGAFSLDGVHPSPRGYALIANKFIEAINTKYGSNLKGVSLYDYRILFPASL